MPRKRSKPDTELGRRLMQIRLENNLSVAEVAQRIGRDKSTISRYEDGRTLPDADTISEYCRKFNVQPNDLLGWETELKGGVTEERFKRLWEQHGRTLWTELNK